MNFIFSINQGLRRLLLGIAVSIFCSIIFVFQPLAFAATSSSYQLQGSVNSAENLNSSSYSLCSKFGSVVAKGSSGSYSLESSLNCSTVAVEVDEEGRRNICGNGLLGSSEQCDDGNLNNGDGCSDICALEIVSVGGGGGGGGTQPPVEEEVVIDEEIPPEEPEEEVITYQPACGNSVKEIPEQCDDGNLLNGDGCNLLCKRERVLPRGSAPETAPETSPETQPESPYVFEIPDGYSYEPGTFIPIFERSTGKPVDLKIEEVFYLTNNISTLFFEQFPGGSGEYLIEVRDGKKSYELQSIPTSEGYFSFQLLEELPDGRYLIFVADAKETSRMLSFVLLVRENDIIEPPSLMKFDGQEFSGNWEDLIVLTNRPVLKGSTKLPATIALHSLSLQRTFIIFTDDNNEFEFAYPEELTAGESETLHIVAHYENGYVSRAQELKFMFMEGKPAASEKSFDDFLLSYFAILLLFIISATSSLIFLALTGYAFSLHFWNGVKLVQKHRSKLIKKIFGVLLVVFIMGNNISLVKAVTTTPGILPYEGILKTAGGVAITTAQDFRFSIWSDSDYNAPADFDGAGSIPGAAPGFSTYQEVQTVTPDSTGFFQVNIGAVTPIPDFVLATHLYLQVEIKTNGAANTSYEILDIDGVANTTDRQPFGTVPYARNADLLDNAEVGTANGDLVILGAGDVFPMSVIPGGSNAESFELDNDGTGGVIQLSFGDVLLNQILSFDPDGVALADGWFNFSDDVNVAGDLSVTGTINGVTIGQKNKTLQLQPEFNGAVLNDSGAGGHKGRLEFLFQDTDGAAAPNNFNYYKWSTQQPTLQDKDLVLRVRLPDDFISFQGVPIVFRYRTEDAVTANNKIDVTVDDSTGTTVGTITGNTNLVSVAFTTTNIGFGGGGTFTAGDEITIRIKMAALNVGATYVSDVNIQYVGSP